MVEISENKNLNLFLALVLGVIITLLGVNFLGNNTFTSRMISSGYCPMMGGGSSGMMGYGGMGGGMLFGLIFWLLLVGALLYIIFKGAEIMSGKKQVSEAVSKEQDALEILRKRYARGEITKKQYEEMKKALGD